MPTPTDATIRTALKTVIETAAPLAIVFPWWALGADEDEWPAILRSSADASGGRNRVHGYVITRSSNDATEGRGGRRNPESVKRLFQYTILALHYYNTASTTASNSDVVFNTELDAISDALDDLTTVSSTLARAEPIAWAINLKSFGGELLHVARGLVSIPSCS